MQRFAEPTAATVTGCEVQRGLVAVAAGVDVAEVVAAEVVAAAAVVVVVAAVVAVAAEQIAGVGLEEGGWGSRRVVGAGEFDWRFAAVDSVDLTDAVAVYADPIHG